MSAREVQRRGAQSGRLAHVARHHFANGSPTFSAIISGVQQILRLAGNLRKQKHILRLRERMTTKKSNSNTKRQGKSCSSSPLGVEIAR